MTIDAKRMQQRLGVSADGIIGRGTLRALFARAGALPAIAGELALAANIHMRAHLILENGLRLAHFMAQIGHESDGFRAMEEYASGAAYEGRAALGNTSAGDGVRFKGRGPIQITGRSNYRLIGQAIGIDLENHPELAAVPSIGMKTACWFWDAKGLNLLADADNPQEITRRINGGQNGIADRLARLAAMKALIL